MISDNPLEAIDACPLNARAGRWLSGRRVLSASAVAVGIGLSAVVLPAAEEWIEVKTAHLSVVSNAGGSRTRALAWQLEQVRSAIASLWPWAKVDLDRPFVVLAVADKHKMRALLPYYWEKRGGVRPASVWVSGADQHYLAIRVDLEAEDRGTINPHVSAYFSYISLVLQQSVDADLPLWFSRGLSGVLSNTIVRSNHVLVGPPIPWHIEALRDRSRLPLRTLVTVTRSSPELASDDRLSRFDAQAWAFVHFLMYGDSGMRRSKVDQFFRLVTSGTASDVAAREALGKIEDYETDFITYVNRSIFQFQQVALDVSVKREGFSQRTLTPAESASTRALLHVAMQRPIEARAAIEEARKADSSSSGVSLAEGLLLDREGKRDEARAALERAVAAGSTSAYAHYRLASLRWGPRPDADTLAEVEKLLGRAVTLNNHDASAYAFLAEVRSMRGSGDPLGLIRRAVSLDPINANHRLTAARILWRLKQPADALRAVEAALALARTDHERARARELQEAIERDKNQ